jgi:hypothetical protein
MQLICVSGHRSSGDKTPGTGTDAGYYICPNVPVPDALVMIGDAGKENGNLNVRKRFG